MTNMTDIESIRKKECSSISSICTRPWETAVRPVQVGPHVYYAGNEWVGVFWVSTPDGIILFDCGMPFQLYLVFEGMREMGFNPKDIRLVLASHGHYDHCGAMKAVLEYSGAKCFASKNDLYAIQTGTDMLTSGFDYQGFTPDCFYEDNDEIELGEVKVKALVVGGHTPGTTCFFFDDTDSDGRKYRIGIHGGLGFTRLADNFIKDKSRAYELRKAYWDAQKFVENEKVDIALSFHSYNVDMLDRLSKCDSWKVLVDSSMWKRMIDSRLNAFSKSTGFSQEVQNEA